MNIIAQQELPLGFAAFVFFAIGACLVAWAVIIERWLSGTPILPYQPRRRVPWKFWDILAIVFFIVLVGNFVSPDFLHPSGHSSAEQFSKEHPLVILISANEWTALAVGGLIGIVVAPITEEMFFRVLFQGWLENVERSWRRRLPMLRSYVPLALMPIFFSSLFFAMAHFRKAGPAEDVERLLWAFMGQGIVSLLSLIFGIAWVRLRAGVTAADLGWAPKKILSDAGLGAVTFVAIAVPIFCINIALAQLLPENYAPDPISIFFFAIALGLLYNRTHRAAPSIALHVALNATSLMVVLLSWNR